MVTVISLQKYSYLNQIPAESGSGKLQNILTSFSTGLMPFSHLLSTGLQIRLATEWMVRVPNPVWLEIFLTGSDSPWAPPSLLQKKVAGLFPWGEVAGTWL